MLQKLFDDKASCLRLNFTRVFKISLIDDNFKPLQQFCAKLNNLQIDEGKIWAKKEIFEKIGPYNKILDPKLWNNIILKFMARDQPIPFTLECLTKLLEIEPDNTFALKYHRATYFMIDRCEETLIDLNRTLEFKLYDTFTLLRNRGETYRKMAKYKEALAD
ncbi:hypothetical protein C2G38_2234651 [Gigaspora rosea]|uniref:Uncharacterized protein n=1 Tax=Gigaspora rosea TaxID=44941 RepID=A0A397TZV1_9GLOM|nr:hypothetical protein C2G38_2234651 [Gigaspora rosea]